MMERRFKEARESLVDRGFTPVEAGACLLLRADMMLALRSYIVDAKYLRPPRIGSQDAHDRRRNQR